MDTKEDLERLIKNAENSKNLKPEQKERALKGLREKLAALSNKPAEKSKAPLGSTNIQSGSGYAHDKYGWVVVTKIHNGKILFDYSVNGHPVFEEENISDFKKHIGKSKAPLGRKKENKPKRERITYVYKGKPVNKLDAKACEELLKESKEHRAKAAKSEKKSKSKPIMEKITGAVGRGLKHAIKNIPASDIKDDPKKELSKINKAIAAFKRFVTELKGILGEDFEKDVLDGELKEIHALAKELHKKYGE